jgi:CubicO group peptidase (beta-lactamase class C family)
MQLKERGALRLDDPLAGSIPWLRQHEGLAQVTIRQALNHTAPCADSAGRANPSHISSPTPLPRPRASIPRPRISAATMHRWLRLIWPCSGQYTKGINRHVRRAYAR